MAKIDVLVLLLRPQPGLRVAVALMENLDLLLLHTRTRLMLRNT
jgi:hypothetical protein